MSESPTMKHRRDASTVALALLCSAVLAVVVGAGAFFWQQLDQSRADNAALANQVRSLGGKPVAEGKPGAQGDQGPVGMQGPQGPPGIQGERGPIGVTGQSPQCLLEPARCVGPKGAVGQDGTQGPQGEPGATGKTGDQGPTGVAGQDGTPGADGKPGTDGAPGRGIADTDCQADGSWLITYTDGTTDTTRGPCRVPELKTGS